MAPASNVPRGVRQGRLLRAIRSPMHLKVLHAATDFGLEFWGVSKVRLGSGGCGFLAKLRLQL